MDYNVSVEDRVLADGLYYNGFEVLKYVIHYPYFQSDMFEDNIKQLNNIIEAKIYLYQQFIVNKLFQLAVDSYINLYNYSYPIRIFEIYVDYVVTYNENCIISYVMDQYEYTGGAQSRTLRSSLNWDIQEGRAIALSDMFQENTDYKQHILDVVRKRVEEQVLKSENNYYAYYYIQISDKFNPNNFYLTEEGIVIFFQGYDISPYASGILSFVVPYTDDVVIPPSCNNNV